MCVFCAVDDAPFYLRKSNAFPRKLIADAVEMNVTPCEKAKLEQFASGAEVATVRSDSSQPRTCGPGDHDVSNNDAYPPLTGLGTTPKQG